MAYNHGREERKWRIWKEAEEKILRECGVSESTIEEIRIDDRAEFNSNRRFYRRLNDIGEYIEETAENERIADVGTVEDLLNDIENEELFQILCTVDKLTLQAVLLKTQGYTYREAASRLHISENALYNRIDRLRRKIKNIF